ncbi:MAG: SDR family NAD(P)-dependent oxidoreductase, partial [Burkholderiaceae bacterium]
MINDRAAIISGAGSGIGRAIAIAFGEAGADVVVNWHSEEAEALEVVEAIRRSGANAIAHRADVS